LRFLRGRGRVVEDGEQAGFGHPGVVLPGEPGAGPGLEIGLLPAEPPMYGAVRAGDLVDGPGVAGGNEQVPVGGDGDGVDVEVVVAGRLAGQGLMRLAELHVVEAVPLEEHLARGDVDLLRDALVNRPIARAAQRGQVGGHLAVRGDQGSVLRGEVELVQIRLGAVARLDRGDDAIRAVGDVGRPERDAGGVHVAGRPGEHRPALILLHGEVERRPPDGRPEPDQAALPVHDHQPGPPDRSGQVSPRRDEDVWGLARRAGLGGLRDVDGRGMQVAGHEGIGLARGVADWRVTFGRAGAAGRRRVRPGIASESGQPEPGGPGHREPAAPEHLPTRPVVLHGRLPPHPSAR
jgi:hypothetical protein